MFSNLDFYITPRELFASFIHQLVLDHCVERSTVDDTDVNLTVSINERHVAYLAHPTGMLSCLKYVFSKVIY